jgi:hypothetical protein
LRLQGVVGGERSIAHGIDSDVLDKTEAEGTVVRLGVEHIETAAELRSISPSGLAVLDVADPRGALRMLLERRQEGSDSVRLTATVRTESVAVLASLVWFEDATQAETGDESHLELFVDGSGSPDWGRLLALSRLPRG